MSRVDETAFSDIAQGQLSPSLGHHQVNYGCSKFSAPRCKERELFCCTAKTAEDQLSLKPEILLELDGLLMFSSIFPNERATSQVNYSADGNSYTFYVAFRPGIHEFLEVLGKHYHLVLFTTATKAYADAVLQCLDPHNAYFQERQYRSNCQPAFGEFTKEVRTLGRPLSRLIQIETWDSPSSRYEQNTVRVKTWAGDQEDRSLFYLAYFFLQLAGTTDVLQAVTLLRQTALETLLF